MKDYSRKNYTDNQFRDWMRQHPSKSIWNPILEANPGQAEYSRRAKSSLDAAVAAFIKQSEFKKPYNNKGYKQMEDDWEGTPGITPGTDRPTELQLPPPLPDPVHVVFDADVVGGYCAGVESTVIINTTEEITGHHISFPSSGFTVSIPTGGTSTEATITTNAGFTGMIVIEIFMVADEVITGPTTLPTDSAGHPTGASNINIFSAGQACCDGVTPMTYDVGNPTAIGQSDQVSIEISDGLGPYQWSVSGTGFSFTSSETSGETNTLNTTSGACGTGAVTITDFCGTVVEGDVLCTTGNWRLCGTIDSATSGCGVCLSTDTYYYEALVYFGSHRIREVICCDHPANNDGCDYVTFRCDTGIYHDDWSKRLLADSEQVGLPLPPPDGCGWGSGFEQTYKWAPDFYGSQLLDTWIWAC